MHARIWLGAIGVGIAIGLAHSAHPQAPPSTSGTETGELLAGPQVDDEAADESGGPAGMTRRASDRADSLPFRLWLRVIEEIDLSPQQRERVEEAAAEFADARAAYFRKFNEELRTLRQRNPDSEGGDQARSREDMRRMREIRSGAPAPDECQKRIWEVLTPAQQEVAAARLAERREEMLAKRERENGRSIMDKRYDRSRRESGAGRFGELDPPTARRLQFLLSRRISDRPATP